MSKLKEVTTELENAINEIYAYDKKQTKAGSLRIRKYLGNIKKLVTDVRKELVEADKA